MAVHVETTGHGAGYAAASASASQYFRAIAPTTRPTVASTDETGALVRRKRFTPRATEAPAISARMPNVVLVRIHVARSRFTTDEEDVLAEAVRNTQTAVDPMTAEERVVYDADEYLGRIMMDGHLLTFDNVGLERVNEMSKALERTGARREQVLLAAGLRLWAQQGYIGFNDAQDALHSALDAIDQQFFQAAAADDSLEILTKQYVREHLAAFIVLE